MKRKFLEDLGLTKEQIDSVMDENGKDIEAEKEKTTTTTAELEDVKKQLKEANSTITDLKKSNADNEALQAKVKEYEDTIKNQKADYEAKVRNLTLDSAIEKALSNAGAKHIDLLSTKIDREKLKIETDGKVTGLDEQISAYKESYKDLFIPKIEGRDPNNNGGGKPPVNNPWSKEHFNLTQQAKILRENPELANQLKNSI
ncbi:phage scaffolding protein [Clostridium tertium]|uniref:Phage scaffolding protein n=1 Tax=Clostridium tertium TaxID=1559 RepID=A0A9X3XSC9_9CLOT|nr:phage scaffolding protein [Clostridium tertium]MDB1956505.1 phage scaffolding protein [Clostridium tertium]MDB1958806.1 phage scaffolding protein [Clostridium tertium]MDB1962327.1 phage scaffolding protein [Clostridium tertium]MDB1967571.1 phage scaffolding protein [Clostridium tertium]MDC4242427.1 phage scaffolding protein [Clostridium tertium]